MGMFAEVQNRTKAQHLYICYSSQFFVNIIYFDICATNIKYAQRYKIKSKQLRNNAVLTFFSNRVMQQIAHYSHLFIKLCN